MKKPSVPNYHRQRFLLALLEIAGGKLSKIDLQKLAFLAHKEFDFDYYDFVPYRYGCYSFQVQSDLKLMVARGWLCETKNQFRLQYRAGACLDADQLKQLMAFVAGQGKLRGKKLLKYVYKNYPYYASRSQIVDEVLRKSEQGEITAVKQKLQSNAKKLFTIGYEGVSFEAYVNALLENNVRLLCDVRRNPLSRKHGFSKGSLSVLLPKLGIAYEHIPALGIPSALRQSLETAKDYAQLFRRYRKQLPQQTDSLARVEALLKQHKRVALTCFEKEHTSCHRYCVSDFLEEKKRLKVCHL